MSAVFIRFVETAFERKARAPGGVRVREALREANEKLMALGGLTLPLIDAGIETIDRLVGADPDQRPTAETLREVHAVADELMGYCGTVDMPGLNHALLRVCQLADAIGSSPDWVTGGFAPALRVLSLVRSGRLSPKERDILFAGLDKCVARFHVRDEAGPQPAASGSAQGGLLNLGGFLEMASKALSRREPGVTKPTSLTFVDVGGLAEADTQQPSDQGLLRQVETLLRQASTGGESATRIAPERFAVLGETAGGEALKQSIGQAGQTFGIDLDVKTVQCPIDGALDPKIALRAMRHALEGCLRNGSADRPELLFATALLQTVTQGDRFRTIVKQRDFEIHFQPIVDLKTRATRHYEVLSRFPGSIGTKATIHLGEELGLMGPFDLAVAEKALHRLMQPACAGMSFAINASAASLTTDDYVDSLLRMTAGARACRARLLVEVTESAALADPEAANLRLARLRAAGIRVCIDDFGAGSASLEYLRVLQVDAVKIDGRFVRTAHEDPRSRTILGHMIELCRSLGLSTIAEMVENEAIATVLTELGVDHGQGWLFGHPDPKPTPSPTASRTARRGGAQDSWR